MPDHPAYLEMTDHEHRLKMKGFTKALKEGLIPGTGNDRNDINALKERLDSAEARIADLEAELYDTKAELGRALLSLRS